MDDEEKPFRECIELFARHDYGAAQDLARKLLTKRMFLWTTLVLLASAERRSSFAVFKSLSEAVLQSFDSPWAVGLLQVYLGKKPATSLQAPGLNAREICQIDFYEGSRLQTLGNRRAARACFERCAASAETSLEQHIAKLELVQPEHLDSIIERLSRQAIAGETGARPYDIITCCDAALVLLKNEQLSDKSMLLPFLEVMLLRLPSERTLPQRLEILELYRLGELDWLTHQGKILGSADQ